MPLFAPTKLFCCICGKEWKASAGYCEGNFDQGTCSSFCHREKHWRKTLSILGKEYYEKYFRCITCESSNYPHNHAKTGGLEACSHHEDIAGKTVFICECQEAVP